MPTANIVYDTHAAIKRLISTGMPEEQAEGVVMEQTQLLEHNLATKQDVALIQKDIASIHKDIEALRQETKQDIALIHKDITSIRKEIEALRQETKKDLQVLSSQLTLRLGAMLVAAVGLLASLQVLAG